MRTQEIEGTWEEVMTHAADLEGHRVKVTVLDAKEDNFPESGEEERLKAFQTLMSPLPNVPVLSDEAMSRESIY